MVILLLALIVLGPDKLPNAARQVGKYMGEFKRMSSGFQDEMRSAMRISDSPTPSGDAKARPADPADTGGRPSPAALQAPRAIEPVTPPAPSPAGVDVTVDGPPGSFS